MKNNYYLPLVSIIVLASWFKLFVDITTPVEKIIHIIIIVAGSGAIIHDMIINSKKELNNRNDLDEPIKEEELINAKIVLSTNYWVTTETREGNRYIPAYNELWYKAQLYKIPKNTYPIYLNKFGITVSDDTPEKLIYQIMKELCHSKTHADIAMGDEGFYLITKIYV